MGALTEQEVPGFGSVTDDMEGPGPPDALQCLLDQEDVTGVVLNQEHGDGS